MDFSYRNNPDALMRLFASSPDLQRVADNVARMGQMAEVAQQFAPALQQFNQNPMQAMQNFGNWAQQGVQQYQAQQNMQPGIPQQMNQAPQNPQLGSTEQQINYPDQGGQQPMNAMSMAMDVVAKFEKKLEVIDNNMIELYSSQNKLMEEVAALRKVNDDQTKELRAIAKTLKTNG